MRTESDGSQYLYLAAGIDGLSIYKINNIKNPELIINI